PMSKSDPLGKLKEEPAALAPQPLILDHAPKPVSQPDRGRSAGHPAEIPAPGWKDILVRSWREVSDNNIFLVSGGATYAVLLALFPGLAALVSIYGLLLDPAQVERQVGALSIMLPPESTRMIADQLHRLVTASSGALGISAVV